MAMDGNGLSVADAMALANGRDGDGLFGGGTSGGILALIIIFVLLFGNGSGFGFGGNDDRRDTSEECDITEECRNRRGCVPQYD